MKLCAIQIPYGHTASDADNSVDFLIRELNNCDNSIDLILTPEYSNAPATFPAGTAKNYVKKSTSKLIEAAKNAAIRCNAVVAVNYLCEISEGIFRNTTRVFDRSGNMVCITDSNFFDNYVFVDFVT